MDDVALLCQYLGQLDLVIIEKVFVRYYDHWYVHSHGSENGAGACNEPVALVSTSYDMIFFHVH